MEDVDKNYTQGQGLVQIIAGNGGNSLRVGDFDDFPFSAAGHSLSTLPTLEYGFAQVDVTDTQLTVSYIAADDGAVMDAFTITNRPANEHVWSAPTSHAGWSDAANWTLPGLPSADWEVLLDSAISGGPLISVVDGDMTVGLGHMAQIGGEPVHHVHELALIDIRGGAVHGALDRVGHDRWPWNGEIAAPLCKPHITDPFQRYCGRL